MAMTCQMALTFFLACLLIQLAPLTVANYCVPETGNYANNSTYQTDLNRLITNFSNTMVDYGFYSSTVGEVNGIAFCRGDLSPDTCRRCISQYSFPLVQACPNNKEAVAVPDLCTIYYSPRYIFGIPNYKPHSLAGPDTDFSNRELYKAKRDNLLSELKQKAASGDSRRKYATGKDVTDPKTMYALVQCSPDLEKQECIDCVEGLIDDVYSFFEYRAGGSSRGPACGFRYEFYSFYGRPFGAAAQDDVIIGIGNGKSNSTRNIVIIVISAAVSAFLILCICTCIYITLRGRKPNTECRKSEEEVLEMESLQFSLGNIRSATDYFSDSNKLGQGGFGAVYKGTLFNGQVVAVKRLSKGSAQGELEFRNEVLIVAKLQHRNLARLLGFCLEGEERLLIYEFVANRSLDHFLFDSIRRSELSWEKRYKIIIGIARGLLYLHEDSRLRIIHRDLKANNILLDEEMNPKISDFGMAKLFLLNQTRGDTNRVVGTYGYMAPEYVIYGKFSVKSDVYSFGILLLEIISGQKNANFSNEENMEGLTSFAWRSWREGSSSNLIDPSMSFDSRSEIMRCIHIGLLCVQENPADRPNMASIILMLSSHSFTLPLPSQPGFFVNGNTNLNSGASNSSGSTSAQMSTNNTSITELHPR